ncbi:TetR/AcrR family transcriptional regulator [Bhargavaea cecembensis]|uniref:TetR/AcrR family transcriptional regulator n=1 Tax=Bhargavaea cecembensis TaxID=394098 RepID=UPI00058FDEEB|nr:TetR/AcrR family transcriptional regulator [Bhargavaea cecembensis]
MDRRKEIILAATRSFSLFGYKATTMDQVAKIAKVGKGTIYTFFANKEELFQEIVRSTIREMRAEAQAVIGPDQPFRMKAHLALMKMLEFREQHALLGKLIEEEKEIRTQAVQEMLGEVEAEIVDFISSKLKMAIERGEIRECNPDLVAYMLFKSYVAFVIDWPETHGDPLPEKIIADLFNDTLFRGLLA